MKPDEWKRFLREVIDRFGCQTGTLHFTDESGDHLELAAQIGVPDALLPVIGRIPFGKGIAGAAAAQRMPVELCNLQTDTSGVARPEAKTTGVNGSLAVPIMARDGETVLGTLGIGKKEPYIFTDAEKTQVLEMASAISEK